MNALLKLSMVASVLVMGSCIAPKTSLLDKIDSPIQVISLENQDLRSDISINQGWSYLEQAADYEELAEYVGEDWEPIDLPHTWNALDATDNDPGYRRDAGWYRKMIYIPSSTQHMSLHFEGVNISSKVYVNGQVAGGHIGGYVGFDIDINPLLKADAVNEILVWVDNSVNPNIIPSQKSDFFIYGGITRDVWLQSRPLLAIDHIQVTQTKVRRASAETSVALELVNRTSQIQYVTLELQLVDPQGNTGITSNKKVTVKPGVTQSEVLLPVLKNPQLWSVKTPNLYTLQVKLSSDDYADHGEARVGYRWFEFKDNGPFYLNGERLLIRGTHRHEEWAGLGNALPNELHRKDLELIKEMGANFVRLAHYPQDPEVYKACDELGLLVWDELPWCRGGMGGVTWKSNTERLFREQIAQNYNHPSIILWSVGNELYWQPDFAGGGNLDSLKGYVSHLNDIAHELDPTRLTTMRKFYDGAEITDVFSPSIWAGWYSGVYKTFETAIQKANQTYKHFLHMEYGGSSHVGRHTENPITGEGFVKADEWDEKPNMVNVKRVSAAGDWSETYIVDLFDWHLMVSETTPWLTGNAQWAFKDFGTPLRPENAIPYINQKGLVDRDGNPKDAYYVFKSYWTTDPSFCYIESHSWKTRFGNENEAKEISVYSNCNQVELLLNGKTLGRRKRDLKDFPAAGFHWDVKFTAGKNVLEAVGFSKGQEVTRDAHTLNYIVGKPGKPEDVALTSKKLKNGNILVQATVVDKNGQICPQYNQRVYFDINGPGHLLKFMGTPTGSDVIEFASGKAAITFIPEEAGATTIEARTQDFKGSYLRIITP